MHKLFLLASLVVMVMYQAVSFYGHLHHMSVMALDMADAVAFWYLMNKMVQGFFNISGY